MGEFVGWYFQDRYSCCLSAAVDDENPRFDLPWHIATLIKEWAQCIEPIKFYILC
jgi:hypothetical protein